MSPVEWVKTAYFVVYVLFLIGSVWDDCVSNVPWPRAFLILAAAVFPLCMAIGRPYSVLVTPPVALALLGGSAGITIVAFIQDFGELRAQQDYNRKRGTVALIGAFAILAPMWILAAAGIWSIPR